MKKSAVLALSALALAGCNNFHSPKGIVATAYKALKNSDSALFFETLRGDAKERYGTLEGMVELQKRVAGQDLSFGESVLIERRREENPDPWTVRELLVYTVDVLGKETGTESTPTRLLETTVECDTERRDPPDWVHCAGPTRRHPACSPEYRSRCWVVEVK